MVGVQKGYVYPLLWTDCFMPTLVATEHLCMAMQKVNVVHGEYGYTIGVKVLPASPLSSCAAIVDWICLRTHTHTHTHVRMSSTDPPKQSVKSAFSV